MRNPLFSVMGPIRSDLSMLPYGFLFIWKPRYGEGKPYDLVPCSFTIGFHWYAPWHPFVRNWRVSLPHVDIGA